MHEKILQGVTIGVVAGMLVYWLTSKHHADYASGKSGGPGDYKPTLGDVRTVRFGNGTCADCQCCGLPAPNSTPYPLAADYLDCQPQYAPSTSHWNLGVSLQLSCEGIDLHSCINRKETASSFPFSLEGPNTVPRPVRLTRKVSCSPQIELPVCCTEVI